ncbi:MAG TPA: uL22 family ribosomal protein, partial [Gemmata sp.]
MDYKALHRFADVGPRKIRLFADLIRGKNVDEALQLLRFYHNRGAKLLLAVVQSAYGNADDRECPDPDGLI